MTGYRLFLNGTQVGTSSSTSYSFTGLTCGTSYTLGVAAYDASGNVSTTATLSQATSSCPDTQPPSTPAGLAASSVTQTSVKLSWNASTDNVGVTGYRLYSNGTQVGTSTSMSYSVHRPGVRDVVHTGSRGVRRGRERLADGHVHAVDERVLGHAAPVDADRVGGPVG